MYYHLEIIMPPTPLEDVERRVNQIMEPFDQNGDEHGEPNPCAFWDFWVIGGRYSQSHLTSGLDQNKLDVFSNRLQEENITVSGVQWGKPELNPADQIPKVDAIWKEFFPDFPGKHCPLFQHGDPVDQSHNHIQWPDVMPIEELSNGAQAAHLIIAAESRWESRRPFRAEYMTQTEVWNGVIHEPTQWDGTVRAAIDAYHERIARYLKGELRQELTVKPDWLAITVDYHS